jgi:hypothetical protein
MKGFTAVTAGLLVLANQASCHCADPSLPMMILFVDRELINCTDIFQTFNANGATYEPYQYVRKNTNYNSPVTGAFPNISSFPSTILTSQT